MKTIFDLIKNDESDIEFEESLNVTGDWIKERDIKSSDFDFCIMISEDGYFKYYLCWDNEGKLSDTIIYRRKNR